MPISNAAILSKVAAPVVELLPLSGDESGFLCFIRDPAGRKCRITSVKPTEIDAYAAAERWLQEALIERDLPPAGRGKKYQWVTDPAGHAGMHVCVEIGAALHATPILY